MKLLNVLANLTSRTNVLGICGGLALAGAALVATPAASAQQFSFGVHIGTPRYVVPAPAYRPYAPAYIAPGYAEPAYVAPAPGYWQDRHWDAWHERNEWRRHEGYGRPVYRPY